MSELIVPESCKPGFVAGRRLKRVEYLEDFLGCVVVLRHPVRNDLPVLPKTKALGTIQTLTTQPIDRKRAKEIVFLSPGAPGLFVPIPVEVLEASDPWAYPPMMPERAVSLLEG